MIRHAASHQIEPEPKIRWSLTDRLTNDREAPPESGTFDPGGCANFPSETLASGNGRWAPGWEWRGTASLARRFDMNTSNQTLRMPIRWAVLRLPLRLLSVAHTLLALFGLAVAVAVVFAAAHPGPRESLLRQLNTLTAVWDEPAANVSAGTIQAMAGASSRANEQRAVTEFIAKRYRVAEDAIAGFVASAYRAGDQLKLDPLLILAVMAIESRYNPVAESNMGARGLMQVVPKFHQEKLLEHGGEPALLDPEVNIQVGAQILREYLRRFGEVETALQMYAGALDVPNYPYAGKVLAEHARLAQASRVRRLA